MEVEQFDAFIEGSTWVFAKTYAAYCPHEYVVGRGKIDRREFEAAVLFIRRCGFDAYYGNRLGPYFIRGDYYYWTMGEPVERCQIINRAKLADYRLMHRAWEWTGKIEL
jgi:hypothetical protein